MVSSREVLLEQRFDETDPSPEAALLIEETTGFLRRVAAETAAKARPVVVKLGRLFTVPDTPIPTTEGGEAERRFANPTELFRERLKSETLDDILPDVFKVVGEVTQQKLGIKPFDVQLEGAKILHEGNVAEMKTGEGKTIVAVLAAYLNALSGEGVHIVTVNDYLAKSQSQRMRPVFEALGMRVGWIDAAMSPEERRIQYAADVTYGTTNEFGFDYLRDNMAFDESELVQRGHHYAVVDEADSTLVDEARTPLEITGAVEQLAGHHYAACAQIVEKMQSGQHYMVDKEGRTVSLTDEGVDYLEDQFGAQNFYDVENIVFFRLTHSALRAKELYKRDRDYIVRGEQIVPVDPYTGHPRVGRQYGEGDHQAIEAEEGFPYITCENYVLGSITTQNYFRMYDKLGAMTATAVSEWREFKDVYGMTVVPVRPNKESKRIDHGDIIFANDAARNEALILDVLMRHATGQPILIGTTSVEKSERLADLIRENLPPDDVVQVLNAKVEDHEAEAAIIAQAGRKGAITVATNMAGRGIDIPLGGDPEAMTLEGMKELGLLDVNADPERYAATWPLQLAYNRKQVKRERKEVLKAGGLCVLGTERHESRRIDDQLRGRAGRQSDPGESRFYLSLASDLIARSSSSAARKLREHDTPGNDPAHPKKALQAFSEAQTEMEEMNRKERKATLEYDNVVHNQRNVIYADRRRIVESEDLREQVQDFIRDVIEEQVVAMTKNGCDHRDWHLEEHWREVEAIYPTRITLQDIAENNGGMAEVTPADIARELVSDAQHLYRDVEERIGKDMMRYFERYATLLAADANWRIHLYALAARRRGIHWRALSRENPLSAYQLESAEQFEHMKKRLKRDVVTKLLAIDPANMPA